MLWAPFIQTHLRGELNGSRVVSNICQADLNTVRSNDNVHIIESAC